MGLISCSERQREATYSLGQPFGHEQRQQEKRRSLGSSRRGPGLSTRLCTFHAQHRGLPAPLPALPTGAIRTMWSMPQHLPGHASPAQLAAASPPRQRFPFPEQLTRVLGSLHRCCTASATWGSFSVIMGSARDAQKHAWRHNPDGKGIPGSPDLWY